MASSHLTSLVAAVALGLFALVAFVDGIWIHLVRLRLHARPASRREHALHTGRALLTPPLLLTVFGSATGPWLWVGVVLLLADQVLEVMDMLEEKRSRQALGGLSTGEYGAHGAVITVRAVAIALALILRPAEAWVTTVSTFDAGAVAWVGRQLVAGSVVAAVVHVALLLRPDLLPVRDPAIPTRPFWRQCCGMPWPGG